MAGKLIVFEGTDGSVKSTQFQRCCQALQAQGRTFRTIRYPRYEAESSALVRMYLGGAFGSHPDDVNAYAASTFFAVDRYASYKMDWGQWYASGGLVLSDRYTTSNAVHQTVKVPREERMTFLHWLYDLEFDKLQLPKPDLVLYLDVPTDFTEKLLRRREQDTHTQADIHEQDTAYLAACREVGRQAAEFYHWQVISCVKDGAMRTIEDIHEEIYQCVKKCLEA